MSPKPSQNPRRSRASTTGRLSPSAAPKSSKPGMIPGAGRKPDLLRKMLQEHEAADRERHAAQAKAILEQAAVNAQRMLDSGYDRAQALEEAEAARIAAMTKWPADAAAAVAAVTLKARLMGLIVDKQAVLHGSATTSSTSLLGDVARNKEEVMEQLRERLGSDAAGQVVGLLVDLRIIKPEDNDEGVDGKD